MTDRDRAIEVARNNRHRWQVGDRQLVDLIVAELPARMEVNVNKKVADMAVIAQQVQTLLENADVEYSVNIWCGGSSVSLTRQRDDTPAPA